MPNISVVSGLIINAAGEVLLAERPRGKRLAGQWEFPGGKVEPDESPAQALTRELMEELTLETEIGEYLGCFPYVYDWGAIDLHVFLVKPLSAPQTTADVHNFRWLPANKIDMDQLVAADVEPLKVYLRRFSDLPST